MMTATGGSARRFRFGVATSDPPGAQAWEDYVRQVESMGYDTLLMTDHIDGQDAIGPAMAVAATVSARLRFGSLVSCNDFYQPVLLAREAATLDRLSGGRFELGVGAGWSTEDYRRAGLRQDPAGVRIARLAESLQILRRCFERRPFCFSGRYYQVVADTEVVPPGPAGGPPILVGGGGPQVLRVAGELADIVSINPRLTPTAHTNSIFGRSEMAAGTSRKVAWVTEAAGSRMSAVELSVTVYAAMVTGNADRAARLLARRAGVDVQAVLESPHALIGTVDEIIDTLQRHRDRWGLSYIVIDQQARHAMTPAVNALAGR